MGRAPAVRPAGDRGVTVTAYEEFLRRRAQLAGRGGFDPVWLPDFLFDFQRAMVEWSLRQGRAAVFADCGLGKTPMQLVWAENVRRHTNGRVMIVTPLAVSHQTVREGEKFGVEVRRSDDGTAHTGITVTNYERLHMFNAADFEGVVCDESSAIKAFDGRRRSVVTEFLRTRPYRLMATATPAPNDYVELGTTSQALGQMGLEDMLNRFFKNQNNTIDTKGRFKGHSAPRMWEGKQWRFKGHAEGHFWRWVASWARAMRRPSDLGFSDDRFILPPLIESEHLVIARTTRPGALFDLPAHGLSEEREEQRRTIGERCEQVAALVNGTGAPAVVWCHLNDEGDLLERLIPDAVQVSGGDSDTAKERAFMDFQDGRTRVLVTKPRIGAFGLNWQHCAHMTFFPSHSFESYYQAVRRCWRFGQDRPVTVDIVTTEGGQGVMKNLQRKADAADRMFASMVASMNEALSINVGREFTTITEVPSWL